MLKSLLRVRFAALLAAFTGQSRKRGRQTKGKAAGYALLMLYCFCAFVFLFYISFSQLAEAFFPAGLGWLFFAMFAIMAFALMFIGSVFTAKSQLFEAKDNELLLSMPVRPGLILLSRMAAMLAMNFVFELVVALPVFAAWLRFGSPDAAGIAAFVLIVLALPLFALAVSCLFAWLISLLTSRMRNTTVITMVLSVVFLLAYFVFCFRMNTYVTQLAANGQAIAGALGAESLIAMTDIAGILQNKDDPSTLLPAIRIDELPELVSSGVIQGGMIPKAECCRNAIEWGVRRVFIIDGRVPHAILIEMLTNEGIGTMFTR